MKWVELTDIPVFIMPNAFKRRIKLVIKHGEWTEARIWG